MFLVDPEVLDDFVQRFAGTDAAKLAFTTRYELVRASSSIDAYNEFIALYGGTVPGTLAIQEVYGLYRLKHTAGGYLDFMERYRSSVFAHDARSQLQMILFEAAKDIAAKEQADPGARIAVLEDFILTNPDAPQADLAAALADALAVMEEKRERDRALQEIVESVTRKLQDAPGATPQEIRANIRDDQKTYRAEHSLKRANELSAFAFKLREELSSTPSAGEEAGPRTDPELVLARYRQRRYERVLLEVYPDQPDSARVYTERFYTSILERLDQIRTALDRQHEELIRTLREEFLRTRELLQAGFDATNQQLVAIESGLALANDTLRKVATGVTRLNQAAARQVEQLSNANDRLSRLQELTTTSIDQSRQLANCLHDDMVMVADGVRAMHQDLGHKLDVGTAELTEFRGKVVQGLGELARGQAGQLAELKRTRQGLEAKLDELKDVTHEGFQEALDSLEKTRAQEAKLQYDALLQQKQLHTDLVTNMKQLSKDQIEAQRQSTRTIVEHVDGVASTIQRSNGQVVAAVYASAMVTASSGMNPAALAAVYDQGGGVAAGAPAFDALVRFAGQAMTSEAVGGAIGSYLKDAKQYGTMIQVARGFATTDDPKVALAALYNARYPSNPLDPVSVGGSAFTEVCTGAGGAANNCRDAADVGEFVAHIYSGNYAAAAGKVINARGDVGDGVRQVSQGVQNAFQAIGDGLNIHL